MLFAFAINNKSKSGNKFQSSALEGLLQTLPSCSFKGLSLPCPIHIPMSLITDKTWKALLILEDLIDTETDVSVSSETGQKWMRRWAQLLLFPPSWLEPKGYHTHPRRKLFPHWAPRHPFFTPWCESRCESHPVSVQGNASYFFPTGRMKALSLMWAENPPSYLYNQQSHMDSWSSCLYGQH